MGKNHVARIAQKILPPKKFKELVSTCRKDAQRGKQEAEKRFNKILGVKRRR